MNKRNPFLPATMLLCLLVSVQAEENQEESGEVEHVIVTEQFTKEAEVKALKTPELLINVPQSLSVVTIEQIEDQSFLEIGDILRYTPGASIGQGEGHRDQITIRGQNTTADFFIDGIRDDVQYFRPLYNLERVEILRGANALTFGRGGGGGIINRVTKTPTYDDQFNDTTVSIDTFGASFATIDSNFTNGEGMGFRLNGFYESLNNHRDDFDGDRFALNPTFSTDLGENTSLLLSYEYVDDDRVVDRGVPALNGRPLSGFEDTFFADPDFNETTFKSNSLKARIDHAFSDQWTVDATIQYADFDKAYQNLFPVGFDDTANTVSLDGYIDTTDRRNFFVQANSIGEFMTGGIGHTLLLGVEYSKQDTGNTRRDSLFPDSADDQITFGFSDPLNIPPVGFDNLVRNRDSEVEVQSLYLQDQVDIGEHLILVGGLRYDRFDIEVTDFIEIENGTADGNDGSLDRVDEEVSPRIGAILKPRENISFYVSYSESFLPRSGDQFLSLSLDQESLSPEEFENKEIGFKWDINDVLSLTTSVFELERDSGTTVDPNDVGNTILISSETRGVELQLIGNITDKWSINAGYSYLDAKEDGRVVNGQSDNRNLSQVPENMFSLWNRYDVNDQLGFGAGVTYQDSQFASISNEVELPSFTRVDAAVFYALNNGMNIQLNVENLFDIEYFPSAHNDNNITTGEPINARLTLSRNF